MSKRVDTTGIYPSNTKKNPIPPAKSSQGRSPSNPTVGVPQGQTSQTTARPGSNVPQRGQNARQNYTPPTGRPTQNTGAQQTSGKGNQTTGTIGATKPTGTTKSTGTSKAAGATGKPSYRSSYASAADLADMNEIMGMSSYTGEAQDVADDFLRQNGVSSSTEYRKKFFAEQEAKRRAREERARQYRELYADPEAAAEHMGQRGGYTGEVEDLVQAEWERNGVKDAAGYRKVSDYRWRNMVGGVLDASRNSVNDFNYRMQAGRAEQLAENDAIRDAANGLGDYEELYRYYLAKYREETSDFVPTQAVNWGEAYNAETARIAEEEGFNDYVRKDGELYRALGAMAPALAVSAMGNAASGYMLAKGAFQTAHAAATVGKVLSGSVTFASASGSAYENAVANGMDPEKAMMLATAAGVVELGTEAISSGLGSVAGKMLGVGGVTDEAMKSLVARVTEDPLVQNALLYVSGVLGEGFEEFLSEWGNYAADKIIGGYDTRTAGEVWGDSWESFRDGAFISGILNTTTLLKKGVPPQTAIEAGVDGAMVQNGALLREGTSNRNGSEVNISETAGRVADSLRGKLPGRDLVQFNEAFENSASGKRLTEALAGMNAADAARLTEAVTDAVADAVKRGESYSSRTDFLTDESVERMTEAVIAEAADALGLADADDVGRTRETIRDSNVAALKDMAKDALTERLQKDGTLRDTAERVRQKRGGESSEFFDDVGGERQKEASSSEKKTLYKDYLEGKFDLKENPDGDGTLSNQRPRNSQEIQNYIEKLREESAKMQEERTKKQASGTEIREQSDIRVEENSSNKELVEDPFCGKSKLKSNVKYYAGEYNYLYETDSLGRICRFFAEKLQLTARDKRLRHDPNTPGKMEYDDAGHLIGDRFGGAATVANLISQLRSVNRGDYRVMEDHLESVIQNGGTVEMEGRIIYNETDLRPEGISIEIKIDGEAVPIFFSNIQ